MGDDIEFWDEDENPEEFWREVNQENNDEKEEK